MIVKVQQSQYTTTNYRQVLVYNEDRSVYLEGDLPKKLGKLLGDRHKAYFKIEIVDNKLNILGEVEAQDW